MCGIAGQLSWNAPPDAGLVARMTSALSHRGPDGEGFHTTGPVSLGHRRLAIIDLSPAAAQPMTDADGTQWIVFNGEIYNYRELRAELSRLGQVFRTQSDTEVILAAFRQYGAGALARFNGMFAFALWNGRERTLLLARDRLGKKPLYYRSLADGGVTFASELQALMQDRSLRRVLNPRALSQFLSLNYTLTQDAIINDVVKVPPAHAVTFAEGRAPQTTCYWRLADHFATRTLCKSPAEAGEATRALLDDAVQTRLVSDVPLGVFLSGGVDSAAIASSMREQGPASGVQSFSMGFREKSFSEVAEARETARFLGINHRDAETDADVAALLPRIAERADEPFADTSVIPTYLLSAFARSHVTVCLSGDGGDEVFAGYETYRADKLHAWTEPVPGSAMRIARAVASRLPVSFDKVSFDYKVRQFIGAHGATSARAHYHWRTIFSESEKQALLKPEFRRVVAEHDPGDVFEKFDAEIAGADLLARGQYVDLKTWLPDDILVKADRASMAHGLELRAPFLDHRLVEFAASLPSAWKLPGLQTKALLKRSQRARVPDAVLQRKKQGFNAPVAHWLTTSFRQAFERLTIDGSGLPLFEPAVVSRLWDEHASGQRDHGHRLLGLIQLQLWCRRHQPNFA